MLRSASKIPIRAAERLVSAAFLCMPEGSRSRAAVRVARALVPVLRNTGAYKTQEAIGFDGPREIALHFLLNALTRFATPFAPELRIRGYEVFQDAIARGAGVLVCGPHAALTLLLIRRFYDDGFDPVVITPDAGMRVPGLPAVCATVQPSPTFLIKTRELLKQGRLVCAMPDRADAVSGRTITFPTQSGPKIIAPALLDIASRNGAAVVFAEVHLEGNSLVGTIEACGAADSAEATSGFIEFAGKCAMRGVLGRRSDAKLRENARLAEGPR